MSPGLGSFRRRFFVSSSSMRRSKQESTRLFSPSMSSPSPPSSPARSLTVTSALAYISARSLCSSSIFAAIFASSPFASLNRGRASAPSFTTRLARSCGVPLRHTTTPFRRCIQLAFFLTMPPPVATTHFLYAATSAKICVSTSRKPSSPSAAKISGMFIFVTCSMMSSVSKKLYPSEAASFLPTEDFPVPIMPTRNTLEPSSTSFTAAPVSASPPASHRIDRRRATARLAGRAGARRDTSPARGAT
mmetsp:Transcript_9727/g.41337  ORF Transcript_9727/g.41337 Transcript_9727/m.41337 type:complete len:247 (+) Transcript_9727:786-1526(+)